MKPVRSVCAASAALFFSACSTFDDSWPRRDGAPDVRALERHRDARPRDKDDTVTGVSWLPLVALRAEAYGPSDPHLAGGTTFGDFAAYGPLFFVGDSEQFHFGEDKALYERERERHFAWGLWHHECHDVRVPSGWRVETEASLLFGLLRWPDVYYVPDAPPEDRVPDAG